MMSRNASLLQQFSVYFIGCLLFVFLGWCDAGGSEPWFLPTKNSVVLDTGKRAVADSRDFTPPVSPDDNTTATEPLTLPYQQPATQQKATEQMTVQWFDIDLPANKLAVASASDNLQLYIPRFNVKGTIAIYWNNQRLWYSRGSHFYNGFYKPLWLTLPVANHLQPNHLRIRTAGYTASGQTLSRIWIGSSHDLIAAYSIRQFLQTDMIRWIQSLYWSISLWVFVISLFYRRYHQKSFYLWFAATAFMVPFALNTYLYDYQPTVLTDQQLLWSSLIVVMLLNHVLIKFVGRFVNVNNVLLERLSSVLTTVVVAVCVLQLLQPPQAMTMYLLTQVVPWFFVPFLLYLGSLIVIFSKQPNRITAFFLATGCLNVVATVHDAQLLLNQGFAEGFLWWPYTCPIALFIIVLFILNNYIKALKAKENANQQLQVALSKKTKELTQTHQKLAKFKAEQALAQERHRLMQEMHDGVGSSLVYAMHSIRHRNDEQSADAIVEVLQGCMEDLKIAIDSLEPIEGDLTLLLGNLRYRLTTRFTNSDISVKWQVGELPPLAWLEAANSIHILRILQEVLTNVFKYSGAENLTLSTLVSPHDGTAGICIAIEDDGTPFCCPPVSELPPQNKGIHNILARTQQLHGHCHWEPLTNGNRFSLWLPLEQTRTS